jgi:SEC-C motif
VAAARNNPCPCGSGRKYKRCCLAEEKRASREARFDDAVGGRIQDWSTKVAGDEIGAAFEEFGGPNRTMSDSDMQVFATWFSCDRELPGGGTPAERYAARPDLSADEREAASRIAAAALGFHRVLAVEPGHWILLEDIVRGTQARARSTNVSGDAVRWDILLGRLMDGETPSLWGPVRFFEPHDEPELLAELRRLTGADDNGAELSAAFRNGALELMRFKPSSWSVSPSFFTPEGDPMADWQARWRVSEPAVAGDRLRVFGNLLPDESPEIEITVRRDRLLTKDRPALPQGALVIEAERLDDRDSIPIARLWLEGAKLCAEAMSEARLDLAIEAVETDFGDIAELVERNVIPIEERLEGHSESGEDVADGTHSGLSPAQEQRLLGSFMTGRMRRWLDEPLPALDGETPREAVAGERRDEVVRLVRGLENHADRARRRGEPGAEVSWLRSELSIEDELAV